MTNKFNNWERLAKVIERFGLSINSFAKALGLNRSETLYHIRKGDFGISADLADRIVKLDKDIDRTWLLSGIGNMLHSDPTNGEHLPFFRHEMAVVLRDIDNQPNDGMIYVPYPTGSDYVVRSFSRSMSDAVTAATDLFLKRLTTLDDVVQGNEYVLKAKGTLQEQMKAEFGKNLSEKKFQGVCRRLGVELERNSWVSHDFDYGDLDD